MLLSRGTGFPAFLLLAMAVASGATFTGALPDIEYARPAGVPLLMDAHIPAGPGPFTAAIIVHGGGWVRGDRRTEVAPLFEPLQQASIATFSIDYRLSSDLSQFGVAIDDVRDAIHFVKSHAAEYRIDPDRIALIGESAGGQLAAMAALDVKDGTSVKAVVALYAPMDLVELAKDSDFVPQQLRNSIRGTPFEPIILARLGQLSPIDNVRPGAPPFLLIHGTEDALVPFAQSSAMCDRLKASGDACEVYPVAGGGHGIRWWESSHPRQAQAYKEEMVRWLEQHL